MAGVLGGKNPKNARAMLDASMITQEQYDKIIKAKKDGKRKKSKSLFDVIKDAVRD